MNKTNSLFLGLVAIGVIGGEAHGMGIRETDSRITSNMANFVPHIIE